MHSSYGNIGVYAVSDIMTQVAGRIWFWFFFFFFCKKIPHLFKGEKHSLFPFCVVLPCFLVSSTSQFGDNTYNTCSAMKGKKIQSGGIGLAVHSISNNHKPVHALQPAAKAKAFPCLSNPSQIGRLHIS